MMRRRWALACPFERSRYYEIVHPTSTTEANGMKPLLFVCYPRCTTCRKAQKWLDDHGIPYTYRDISQDNPTADELKTWHAESGLPIRRLFNTSGMKYRELKVKAQHDAGMSDEDCYQLLATDGMLVKRPILVGEDSDGDPVVFFGFKEADWERTIRETNLS